MSTSPKYQKSYAAAYLFFKPQWTDALELYEPLRTTIGRFLTKYPKEDPEDFANRVRQAAQINMVYLIVEATLSMLFSTNIDITAKKHSAEVEQFVNRATPQGDSLIDLLREQIAPCAFIYGSADVVVDMPEQKDDKLSVDQARARGLTPYAYLIQPLNRINWSVDGNANFTEYYSEDILNSDVQSELNLSGSSTDAKEYNVWTLDTISRYGKDGEEIETKPNPYGYIPILTCAPISKSQRYPYDRLGRSLIQDIIPLQCQIINVMSVIWDYHQMANFPYRIMKQDTSNGDEEPTEEELAQGGNMSGMKIRGKDSDFFLVQPDPNGVNAMMDYLSSLIERCYQQVMMPSDANTNKTHQSGNSIRSNQAILFNKLTTYTKRMERTVKEIVEMALRVQGIDPIEAEVKVTWDTNFSYESFTNSQQQLMMVIQNLADKSPTMVIEFAKKVMSPQLFGSGQLDKGIAELEKWAKKSIVDPNAPATTLQQENTQLNAAEKVSESGENGN